MCVCGRELLRVLKKSSDPQEEKKNPREKNEPTGRKNEPARRKSYPLNTVVGLAAYSWRYSEAAKTNNLLVNLVSV